MQRIATIFLLFTIMIIGVSGCMKKKEIDKHTIDEKRELVIEYLKDRYKEDFEGISYEQASLLQSLDMYYLYPKNGNENDFFRATGQYDADGIYVIAEGYTSVLVRKEYEKVVKNILDEYYAEYKIHSKIRSSELHIRWPYNKPLDGFDPKEEILNVSLYLYIYVKESSVKEKNAKEIAMNIASKMQEKMLGSDINLWIIKNEKYDSISMNIDKWQKASSADNVVEKYNLLVNEELEVIYYEGE